MMQCPDNEIFDYVTDLTLLLDVQLTNCVNKYVTEQMLNILQ
jgi:hypothetical protein